MRFLYHLFFRDAAGEGAIAKRATELAKPRGKCVQRKLFKLQSQTPDKPACPPDKLVCSPERPACAPNKPACEPDKPVRPQPKPAYLPDKPVRPQPKPAYLPDKPVCSPEKPACPPNKPVRPPPKPACAPDKHAIAYNAIRALILQSAAAHQQELGRISFKGAVDLLRQWLPHAATCHDQPRNLMRWHDELLETIASL